jgi:hypothetical protein
MVLRKMRNACRVNQIAIDARLVEGVGLALRALWCWKL